ncbi:MAG: Flp family type IVb pilin [Bryobacterales bacterium]|nr:Flp family type IVb pilin [Bryobacteraceae bacterium]MDW8129931.1 Flp family type IVb pilin [Bryobacterales bacterium]
MTFLKNFLKDERGQDLVEYTLLLAFVALASAALFMSAGESISGIWTKASERLSNAAACAGASS